MFIKRLLVVIAIAAGVTAPTASARVATEPVQPTAEAPQHMTLTGPESRFAAIAAQRDGITTQSTWTPRDLRTPDAVDGSRHIAPDPVPAVELPAPEGGLYLVSALVGLAISVLVAAIIVTGRTRRRRVPLAG